jgi:ABC-type nitrate/sulfonate/bicarbonate transport system ATPase subunit
MTEIVSGELEVGMAVITDQKAVARNEHAEVIPLIQLRLGSPRSMAAARALMAFKGVDIDIHAGEFVAIMGPSGRASRRR